MARVTVQQFQRAVLHQSGAAAVVLGPGRHRYRMRRSALTVVDLRPSLLKVAGQEVLTADGVGVRATVVVRYAVSDPLRWVLSGDGHDGGAGRLYLAAQLAVRDALAQVSAEDLISSRGQASQALATEITAVGSEVGAAVEAAGLRNLSFPGELHKVVAQVAIAEQEAAASLERTRGETATLRSLANAARTIDANPALGDLRAILAIERSGGTVVLGRGDTARAPRGGGSRGQRGAGALGSLPRRVPRATTAVPPGARRSSLGRSVRPAAAPSSSPVAPRAAAPPRAKHSATPRARPPVPSRPPSPRRRAPATSPTAPQWEPPARTGSRCAARRSIAGPGRARPSGRLPGHRPRPPWCRASGGPPAPGSTPPHGGSGPAATSSPSARARPGGRGELAVAGKFGPRQRPRRRRSPLLPPMRHAGPTG